jgi:hypothetical protein
VKCKPIRVNQRLTMTGMNGRSRNQRRIFASSAPSAGCFTFGKGVMSHSIWTKKFSDLWILLAILPPLLWFMPIPTWIIAIPYWVVFSVLNCNEELSKDNK